MKRILYTTPGDDVVKIIIPAPKDRLEKVLGPLTKKEYETHVIEKSLPINAENVRNINLKDYPSDRHFRNAWVDKAEGPQIDICCEKARDLVLERVRLKRELKLTEQDKKAMQALRKGEDLTILNKETQALLDITEPLKVMQVKGKLNDKKLLQEMRDIEALLD